MASDPRLLVPATPALLDDWCGPVRIGGWPVALAGTTTHKANGDPAPELLAYGLDLERDAHREGPVSEVSLDLSLAECRDRVARVLAATRNLRAARSWPPRSRWSRGGRGRSHRLVQELGIQSGGVLWECLGARSRFEGVAGLTVGMRLVFYRRGLLESLWVPVPGLADLDPQDDTRLPDGSRLVDALALAAVAREVLCGQ